MKTFLNQERNKYLRKFGRAVVFAALFCGGGIPAHSQQLSNQNKYTSGIGIYPGNPAENYSPFLVPDNSKAYRNIAHLRSAFASSTNDYNLTSQLLTDGIITTSSPQYFDLKGPNGSFPKRAREWMIDEGPYSKNTLMGTDTYFQFAFENYKVAADKLNIVGSVAFDEKLATKGYQIICLGSNDGKKWVKLGELSGKGLPGKMVGEKTVVTDPNKQTGTIEMPMRKLDETVSFNKSISYSNYKIAFKMEGAYQWFVNAANFSDKGKPVEVKPSQFFSSAWMSAGSGKEWTYVDFGTESEFDKVIINWINKAVDGKIQISNDAKQWKDVASLSSGRVSKEVIKFVTQKARYMRVLMNKSVNNKPYIISEIEVMGRGGLIPVAKPLPQMVGNEITLSGGAWKLQRSSEVKGSGLQISLPEYDSKDWIVATVPGTVLTSYKNIGAIADPNYADNQLQTSESFFNSNFWYRDEFVIPAGFMKDRLFLNFDGINWKANVYLNGKQLGNISGAFIRGKYDVTNYLVSGKNVLAVEIVKNEHIGSIKEKNEQNPDFNGGILGADNPTFHATIGWDWIPTVRGRNIGIWNDVFLSTTGDVTISDPFVQSVLPLPDTTSVRLTPEVIVKNNASHSVTGILSGIIGDISFQKTVTLAAGEERTETFKSEEYSQLDMKNPHLWWPNGYGDPYLYNAGFTFKIADKVSDSNNFKVGIRQMTYNEDNSVLRLFVNGRRFIGRGGNWGFSEVNLNYRGREYETAVKYHKDMNFTMIRDWVGMTGDKEFYEACDRNGIMIWQDFWLANPADGPDPYYPEMFVTNAEDYIKRIRKHPSIGLYCGRNEGVPTSFIDGSLRKLLQQEHPGIHYISDSADKVVSGHGPYRMLPAKEYFTLKTGNDCFHSERGMPNVMTYESMQRTYSPKEIWPQSNEWGMHDYTREGAQGCTSFNEIIAKGYGEPKSAKEFSELAQWVNYNGHRSLFESRSKNRKGLLMWMSHPCWPSMVWQTYDYYFEPTAGYFGIKKASEPLHIQWNEATDTIEVVNYSAGVHDNLLAKATIYNMDGTAVWSKETSVNSLEDTTNKCIKLDYPTDVTKVHFIKLVLFENGKVVSDNFYQRTLEENNYQELSKLPKVELATKVTVEKLTDGNWKAVVTLENKTKTPALMIRINTLGDKDGLQILPILYSDNYFSLLPSEKKVVTISWKEADTRGNAPNVVVTGYNVK